MIVKTNICRISPQSHLVRLITHHHIVLIYLVLVVEGYIWRYAKRVGATLFIRGIRSWEKDGKDERSLQILNTWGPLILGLVFPIKTIYLIGDPKYNHVSSTLIRDICNTSSSDNNSDDDKNKEESLSKLVPTHVAGKIAKLYGVKK
ncbi:MAG: phosphopantetheine adenylyltransferase [Bacillariaceae sp.]|jgi:phosphopantetheine adenylyltransferase